MLWVKEVEVWRNWTGNTASPGAWRKVRVSESSQAERSLRELLHMGVGGSLQAPYTSPPFAVIQDEKVLRGQRAEGGLEGGTVGNHTHYPTVNPAARKLL